MKSLLFFSLINPPNGSWEALYFTAVISLFFYWTFNLPHCAAATRQNYIRRCILNHVRRIDSDMSPITPIISIEDGKV